VPTFSNIAATSLTVSWPAVTGASAYKLARPRRFRPPRRVGSDRGADHDQLP
jgi:hypothetical protein